MNKARRFELKILKYKKRLKIYNLENCNSLRTTSKPCSCFLCSGDKYKRKIKHKNNEKNL